MSSIFSSSQALLLEKRVDCLFFMRIYSLNIVVNRNIFICLLSLKKCFG